MKNIINKFPTLQIAVIGDLILDKYIFGDVDRISPEAPVPIVRVKSLKYVPGGAANVAANITALGGNAYLFGITGDDPERNILLDSLNNLKINANGVLTDPAKMTTKKTRVLGVNQQLLRIDHENTDYIETHLEDQFLANLKTIKNLDAVVVSDYAKGTITQQLMEEIKTFCKTNKIILLVDPKPKHKSWYKGVDYITPNKTEAQAMSSLHIESNSDYYDAAVQLSNELESNIILTAGSKGMFVYEGCGVQGVGNEVGGMGYEVRGVGFEVKDFQTDVHTSTNQLSELELSMTQDKEKETPSVHHIPTVAREVYDVSGAGDTVVASLALALSAGASLIDAAKLANQAAGIKVGKLGTSTVSVKELLDSI